jgi:hypothetical protein
MPVPKPKLAVVPSVDPRLAAAFAQTRARIAAGENTWTDDEGRLYVWADEGLFKRVGRNPVPARQRLTVVEDDYTLGSPRRR